MNRPAPVIELGQKIDLEEGVIELQLDDSKVKKPLALPGLEPLAEPLDQVGPNCSGGHLKIDITRLTTPCSFSRSCSISPSSNQVPPQETQRSSSMPCI